MWKVLAAGRNVLKAGEKVEWDGRVYPDDLGFNQTNFRLISSLLSSEPGGDSKKCRFRLRSVPWSANATRSERAATRSQSAFDFKGGAFSTSNELFLPFELKPVSFRDRKLRGTLLTWARPGAAAVEFRFLFVFRSGALGQEPELQVIESTSKCAFGSAEGKRVDCQDRFHYYSLEFQCD